jgi:hypothetical protein
LQEKQEQIRGLEGTRSAAVLPMVHKFSLEKKQMEGYIYLLNRDNAALLTSKKVLEEMIISLEE